jgi:hypothetical protein
MSCIHDRLIFVQLLLVVSLPAFSNQMSRFLLSPLLYTWRNWFVGSGMISMGGRCSTAASAVYLTFRTYVLDEEAIVFFGLCSINFKRYFPRELGLHSA